MYALVAMCVSVITSIQAAQGQEYLGCYRDLREDRILSSRLTTSTPNNTVESCISTCRAQSHTYAGVEFGEECWCGDFHNFSRNGEATEPDSQGYWCNFRCRGNNSQTCGGIAHVNVYAVCPHGRFSGSTDYTGECYCEAGHICLYSTGQCPAGCQDGWYGDSCSTAGVDGSTEKSTSPYHPTTLASANHLVSVGDYVEPRVETHPWNTDDGTANPTGTPNKTGLVVGTVVAAVVVLIGLGISAAFLYRRVRHGHATRTGPERAGVAPSVEEDRGVTDGPTYEEVDVRTAAVTSQGSPSAEKIVYNNTALSEMDEAGYVMHVNHAMSPTSHADRADEPN